MAEYRNRTAQRLEYLDLHGGIGDMVFAANDVADGKVEIVDHRGQHIDRHTVRTDEDGIAQMLGLKMNVAADQIVPVDRAGCEFEAPGRRDPLRHQAIDFRRREFQRGPVIDWRSPSR